MKTIRRSFAVLLLLFIYNSSYAQAKGGACCPVDEKHDKNAHFSLGEMKDIPNLELVNQEGEKVKFYDLIKDKVVALNFIFTSCKTICPPMGANFANLKKKMEDRVKSKELVMLTMSIDPLTDTPQRLKAWSNKFEAGEGWTLLTGKTKDINTILKKLKVYTALKEEHAPVILLGKEGTDNWVRTNGLANVDELAKTLNSYLPKKVASTPKVNRDEKYFTNVVLKNQNGEEKKLYKDLMQGKVVIINPFFTQCTGVCPVMNTNLQKIQNHLGDKLGTEVNIISLTVDHENDTQKVLFEYAQKYGAKEGWHFLTGEKANIEFALGKLGKLVNNREAHDAVFLVGNLETKLWKKVNGLANINDIIALVDSVVYDSVSK
jgi:cytochrome oxidase Cu insertion factor (SCO1/SenC/PrrC family)